MVLRLISSAEVVPIIRMHGKFNAHCTGLGATSPAGCSVHRSYCELPIIMKANELCHKVKKHAIFL